ncbi:hypothetical protein BDR05DRAFT_957664 [Suillus weaverae]|nr:hypothetical protein BDR05DRAFT_957664 [Suillus weaverae]
MCHFVKVSHPVALPIISNHSGVKPGRRDRSLRSWIMCTLVYVIVAWLHAELSSSPILERAIFIYARFSHYQRILTIIGVFAPQGVHQLGACWMSADPWAMGRPGDTALNRR